MGFLKGGKGLWQQITFLIICCLILQKLFSITAFPAANNVWHLNEDLQNWKIPAYKNVSKNSVGRSKSGIIIGIDNPGYVEWKFPAPGAPGPLPSVVQPFFIPDDNFPAKISLITGDGSVPHPQTYQDRAVPRTISKNTPLRYRAVNLSGLIRGSTSYSLRFEGRQALLKGVRFYQPSSPEIPMGVFWGAVFFLGACLVLAVRQKNSQAFVLCLIVFAGFFLRWRIFGDYYNVPLEGDAPGYLNLARNLSWSNPLSTGVREPVFIWFLRLAGFLFGDSGRSARFMTLIFSCSLIPLTWMLTRALGWPKPAGLLAAGLLAFNPFSIFMSSQALQLELFTLLILVFSVFWLKNRPFGAGLAGGILLLTRIQSVLAVFPLGILAAWKFKYGVRSVLLFLIPVLILLVPHLAAVRKNTGSFTGNLDHAAKFYQAAEQLGDPEHLSSLPPLTLREYLFSKKFILKFVPRFLNGYFQILFNPYNPYNRIFLNSHDSKSWNLLLLPFFWLGLFLCLRDDRRFLWLGFFFISGLPFLQDQFREPRLLFHVAPFFAMLSSLGICVAGSIAASFLKNRKITGDVASYLHIYPQAVESGKK